MFSWAQSAERPDGGGLRSQTNSGDARGFQEFNPGVSLTWEKEALDYSIGGFYNSYEDVSVLGLIGYDVEIATKLEVGAFAGLAYYPGGGDRFSMSVGDMVPLIGLQTTYRSFFAHLFLESPANTNLVFAHLRSTAAS